jgi:hypothetical protein
LFKFRVALDAKLMKPGIVSVTIYHHVEPAPIKHSIRPTVHNMIANQLTVDYSGRGGGTRPGDQVRSGELSVKRRQGDMEIVRCNVTQDTHVYV